IPPSSTVDIDVMGASSLWRMMRCLLTADYSQNTPRTAGITLASHVKNRFCGYGRRA
ncbi:hypothetical protein BGZ94_004588, partial [Podila epigama]